MEKRRETTHKYHTELAGKWNWVMGRSSVFWELYTALTDHIDFLACTNESFLNVIFLIPCCGFEWS